MFSSSNSINPSPFLPPSSSSPPPPPDTYISHHTNHDIFFHHHHHHHHCHRHHHFPSLFHNPVTGTMINNMVVVSAPNNYSTTMTKQVIDQRLKEDRKNNKESLNLLPPVIRPNRKKDRHSKICTAQGMRDRRVRLSIGIARKFFDLQEMLGFDKASKTLEWLLTKSKTAIREMASTKSSSSGDANEAVENMGLKKKMSSIELQKMRKAAINNNLVKVSREKARERARARTREKLCTKKKLDESKKNHETTSCSSYSLNQIRSSSDPIGIYEKPAQVEEQLLSFHHPNLTNQASTAELDFTEESIVIKRKLKPSSILATYQQNYSTSKDLSFISNNYNLPSLPQNSDIGTAIARSSFYAMINTNLSTELQIYGKPWEAHYNQSLH